MFFHKKFGLEPGTKSFLMWQDLNLARKFGHFSTKSFLAGFLLSGPKIALLFRRRAFLDGYTP